MAPPHPPPSVPLTPGAQRPGPFAVPWGPARGCCPQRWPSSLPWCGDPPQQCPHPWGRPGPATSPPGTTRGIEDTARLCPPRARRAGTCCPLQASPALRQLQSCSTHGEWGPEGVGDTWRSWGHLGELRTPGGVGDPQGSWPHLDPSASFGDPSGLGAMPAGALSPVPHTGHCPCQQDSHPNTANTRSTEAGSRCLGRGGQEEAEGHPPITSFTAAGLSQQQPQPRWAWGSPDPPQRGHPSPPHPPKLLFSYCKASPPPPALRAAAVPTQHRGAGSQGVLLGGPGRGGTGACPFKGGGCHAESPFLCWRGGQAPRGHGTGRGTARRGEGWSQLQTEPRQLSARGVDRVRHHG